MPHATRTALALALAVLAGGCLTLPWAPNDPAAREVQQLQGTWRLTEAALGGQSVPADEATEVRLVIKGNELALVTVDRKAREARVLSQGTFRVDPARSPRAIDVTILEQGKPKTRPGIVSLDGDRLRLCQGMPAEGGEQPAERPASFTPEAGQLQLVQTFVRGKR